MHIKKGDNVKVIAGKDKGKEGQVLETQPKHDRVVVEGVNVIKKHQKPTQFNPEGGILETEAAIHVSNVQLLDLISSPDFLATLTFLPSTNL